MAPQTIPEAIEIAGQTIKKAVFGKATIRYQSEEMSGLSYPAILYSFSGGDSSNTVKYANNGKYYKKYRFSVQVIDSDPNSTLPDKILGLPYSSLDNVMKVDRLYHYNITVYI